MKKIRAPKRQMKFLKMLFAVTVIVIFPMLSTTSNAAGLFIADGRFCFQDFIWGSVVHQ